MIIVVDGEEYKAVTQQGAPLGHMIEFKRQAMKKWPEGRWDAHGLQRMGEAQNRYKLDHDAWEKSGEGEEPEPPSTTEEFIILLAFLSIRKVKQIRLDDLDNALIDLRKEPEDDDISAEAEAEEAESDPTGPGQDSPATPDDAPAESPAAASGPPVLPSTTSNDPSDSGWPT